MESRLMRLQNDELSIKLFKGIKFWAGLNQNNQLKNAQVPHKAEEVSPSLPPPQIIIVKIK